MPMMWYYGYNLQTALNYLQEWLAKWGLRFSPSKTKAIIFMRHQLVNSRRYSIHQKVLKLYGANIEFVKQHRYLGMIFDSSLTWDPHIKALKISVEAKINILKAIRGAEWGADRHTLLMLYKTIMDVSCIQEQQKPLLTN